MAGQWGDFDWTGFAAAPVAGCPAGVCTVVLAVHGNGVKVEAVTKTGTLCHTRCGANGRAVSCDVPWAAVHPQPGAA
ncbi:hypothetical protein [Streptomyces sp. TBY4]|uniref:hypothetical protein n=1 Tax=Streptomyces sp. TBY4 TaxID=2962030 RepID=UPI0020B8E637|nr:hypothetical protein [Streptomyces sp. TBY4]MCP3753354.1 hypothetical protein [Streptomyces sp. TBY4]